MLRIRRAPGGGGRQCRARLPRSTIPGAETLLVSFLKWLTDNRLGTHLFTRWRGERVGEDALGNVYYRRPGAADWRDERRWVVYAGDGELEASSVPAGWNAWLHKNREKAPSELPLAERFWEKPHAANPSGTVGAYLPPGHEKRGGQRDHATGDYEAWRP
ncbi:MAG: NADH:ubiquinone oxidoreductase subunit NDUFA12 [Geminicoccaceae bacterium]|nr:NADH:ubiquinone oxidoreductase subunit NDUFA12 [Geminicoccaceae bacterium]